MGINWTVVGTLGAVVVTTMSNYLLNWQKRNWDNDVLVQSRKWSQQDNEAKVVRENTEAKFQIYNNVLKADGEALLIYQNEMYSNLNSFKIADYKSRLRPILYDGLHKIDPYVVEVVRSIDSKIEMMNFLGEADPEWYHEMATQYSNMLQFIEKQYKNE